MALMEQKERLEHIILISKDYLFIHRWFQLRVQ